MAITKEIWSASSAGQPLDAGTTGTPGTLLHTAHATSKDEFWLYAVNRSGAARTLTVEYGGVAANNQIIVDLPANEGLKLVIPGLLLSNALEVRAFADGADVGVAGWVNRIS